MEIKVKPLKHDVTLVGEISLSFALLSGNSIPVREELDRLLIKLQSANKAVKLTIEEYKEPRSLSANAYFHLLVSKIAEKIKAGEDEVKCQMVLDYGSQAVDETNTIVGFKVPQAVNAKEYYKYVKYVGEEKDPKGKIWNLYIAYKETHKYNTKEMSKLIEGTVSEAQELGIETKTPAEIASMLALMEKAEGK